MSKPLTLKDLARELGLSVPTVSLALRNAGTVSAATCARVQDFARERGYTPNLYAAVLATKQGESRVNAIPLALVRWPALHEGLYPSTDFVRLLKQHAQKMGYQFDLYDLAHARELPALLEKLHHQGVQGIFFTPVGIEFTFRDVDWARFCVICCGRYNHISPFHTVRTAVFEPTRRAFVECLKRGYQRVGVVLYEHDPKIQDDFSRYAAVQYAQQEVPVDLRIPVLLLKVEKEKRCQRNQIFEQWFKKNQPDVVIAFSVSYYFSLLKSGVRLPEDVGFLTLHYGDDVACRHITGLRERTGRLGAAAMDQMDSMIRHHQQGAPSVPSHVLIESEWMEGTTLPDRTAS